MFRSRQTFMVVVFLSLLTAQLAVLPAWAEAVQWRIATTMERNPLLARAFKEFMAKTDSDKLLATFVRLERETVETADVLSALKRGAIQLALVATEQIEAQREIVGPQPLALMNYPFIFDDLSQVVAFERSYAGRVALARLAEAGLLGIEYWNAGLTQLVSREPVTSLGDFEGNTVAVLEGRASTSWLKRVSAVRARPFPRGEVYRALKMGAVDAAEVAFAGPPAPSNAFGFVTDTGYRSIVAALVANRDAWHSLPARAQSRLVAVAQQIAASLNNRSAAEIERTRGELRAQNVRFLPPSVEFLSQLKEVALRTWAALQPDMLGFFETAREATREAPPPPARPSRPRGERGQPEQVEVLFVTDRNDETETGDPGATGPRLRFGSQRRYPPVIWCGKAIVSVARDRSRADEDQNNFAVTSFNPIPWGGDGSDCARLIQDHLPAGDGSRIVLLVHGYANTFYNGLIRAASVATDLLPKGPIVLWSWPSFGNSSLLDYKYDEDSVMYTRYQLSTFLEKIKTSIQPARVDIVAHSMGNRAVIHTLEFYLKPSTRTDLPTIENIVLAAPDIATDNLRPAIQLLIDLASQRLSLYASRKDRALKAAQAYAQGPRAGLIDSSGIVTRKGMDSIDASAADTARLFSWYHAYLFDTLAGVDDLMRLVIYNQAPGARGLVGDSTGSYWRLEPTP